MRMSRLLLARHLVPRIEPGPLRARRLLLAERDASAHVAVAHAREHVDARAQAIDAAQLRIPHVGLVAEELLQESPIALAAQALFDLARGFDRLVGRPARKEARVHEHEIERAVDVHEASRAQPFEQLVAIGREQHFAELGIDALLILALALADREQREIVIAEHDDRRVAERLARSAAPRAIARRD